jgi:tRNA 2-thiouridine synthesizing protein E
LAGRTIIFDEEGFIKDPDDWDEEVAALLAAECGLEELSETHWRVLRFLREYYLHHGRAPLNRQLKEGVGLSVLEMEGLFPGGIRLGCRRLAGLPNPKSCL